MGSTLRTQVGAALKVVAGQWDRVRPPAPGITVLIYHRVGARTGVAVDLPADLFREQMAALAGRAISLDAALDLLDGPPPDDAADMPRPVVVTFDDGTADVVDIALPILAEFEIPALLYVATDFIETGSPFPDDGQVASWSALADAASTGYLALGSHTHTHALLDRLDPALVADELDRSIELIGERTGWRADHFAYPKAVAGSAVADDAVRARFRSAAVAGTRPNPYGATDPWMLARSPIQVADDVRWFARKADGGLRLEDDLRRAANRVRYRNATT